MAIRCTYHLQAAVLSHGFSSQFAVQRNEHINHAECFMRRFKLKISASGTCRNNHATL
jgi:hypothetical protein